MDMSYDARHDDIDEDVEENVALKPASTTRIVELAREYCTAEQWGEWLSVPLEHAAAEGDQELAEELLLAGASGDPISAAVRGDQSDLVHHLLELDHESPNLQDHHLHLAVRLQKKVFVDLFLRRGLKLRDDRLLRLAVTLGNEAIVSLLLQHGAKPDDSPDDFRWDEKYSTPLLIAAREGHAGILRKLLDAGASVGRRLSIDTQIRHDPYPFRTEDTPVKTECALDLAAIGGDVDMVKAIVERDPSRVNSVAESTGNTALLYAVKHCQAGAVDALIEAGADLEARDKCYCTALHVAASSRDYVQILRTLLTRGAEKDAEGHDYKTPLSVAVKRGNTVGMTVLISAGADVNKALLAVSMLSSFNGAMIRTLSEHGADINKARAPDGNTPLHLACAKALGENVKLLLEADGDETALNGERQTPMDVIGRNSKRVVSFLERSLRLRKSPKSIRFLLENAPRERAWRRRAFLVLCRRFPGRARLHSRPLRSNDIEECSLSTAACRCPAVGSATKKATKSYEASYEDQPKVTRVEGACSAALGVRKASYNFPAAMDRLISLQPDEVFRKIVGFL